MEHPITPPPELVEQWKNLPEYTDGRRKITMVTLSRERLQEIADRSARWGADAELDACCEWIKAVIPSWTPPFYSEQLRAARRSKPPSLNEVALQMLGTIERDAHYLPEITDTIRRALEQLDD